MQDKKGHDARAIANLIIKEHGKQDRWLTAWSLSQLIYIAHGRCLACTGSPLIKDDIRAWEYGPVIPNVYWEFVKKGLKVKDEATFGPFWNKKKFSANISDEELSIIKDVVSNYSNMEYYELTDMLSRPGTPWVSLARSHQIIPNEEIKKYYENIIKNKLPDGYFDKNTPILSRHAATLTPRNYDEKIKAITAHNLQVNIMLRIYGVNRPKQPKFNQGR